jgi:hypothetical protein
MDQSKAAKSKKMKMALHELDGGENLGNGQKVVGRVFPGSEKTTLKGQAIVTKYIVTGPRFSDILLVEGWGPHAARLSKACVDGNVVEISGAVPIRELNKAKKAFTASSADIFMSFTAKGAVEILSKDLEYPRELPCQNMQELKDADGGLVQEQRQCPVETWWCAWLLQHPFCTGGGVHGWLQHPLRGGRVFSCRW